MCSGRVAGASVSSPKRSPARPGLGRQSNRRRQSSRALGGWSEGDRSTRRDCRRQPGWVATQRLVLAREPVALPFASRQRLIAARQTKLCTRCRRTRRRTHGVPLRGSVPSADLRTAEAAYVSVINVVFLGCGPTRLSASWGVSSAPAFHSACQAAVSTARRASGSHFARRRRAPAKSSLPIC